MKKLKIAIIGYGGIARVHNKSYRSLVCGGWPIELVAVCDRDLSRVRAELDFNLGNNNAPLPEGVRLYSDIDDLILREEFDIADICLPTFLHKSVSIKLMEAGKHVICEKPMALTSADCDEMVACAEARGVKLMIAHCVRFDAPYRFLKECIDDGRFGAIEGLCLDRHSVYPTWGEVFKDNSKTGGCTLDTHIHDIDVARFLLGEPDTVSAVELCKPPMYQVNNTTLRFGNVTVVAAGSWDSSYELKFRCGYRARFERASVVYEHSAVKVIPFGGEPYTPELIHCDYTTEELAYFIGWVSGSVQENTICPPAGSGRRTPSARPQARPTVSES